MTIRPLVLAVGPLPPPVHGLAVVHQRLTAIVAAQARVLYFEVGGPLGSTRRVRHGVRRVWRLAWLLGRFACRLFGQRPKAVLISLSAGPTQCFDAGCAWLAWCAGVTVYVHHHSFAYLLPGTVKWYHRWTLASLRPHSHIVLCDAMARQLAVLHRVPGESTMVLSNAAFVDAVTAPAQVDKGAGFVIGFLSQIVESKGIFEYLDLLQTMQARHGQVTGLVAGAVAAETGACFARRLAELSFVRHVGALGSEQQKAEFFARIDVLVFPSKHSHEAEPLVVAEALAHGVPVIATARGCLRSVWAFERVVQVFDEATFAADAAASAEDLMRCAVSRQKVAQAAQALHRDLRAPAARRLSQLVAHMVRGQPVKGSGAASATSDA